MGQHVTSTTIGTAESLPGSASRVVSMGDGQKRTKGTVEGGGGVAVGLAHPAAEYETLLQNEVNLAPKNSHLWHSDVPERPFLARGWPERRETTAARPRAPSERLRAAQRRPGADERSGFLVSLRARARARATEFSTGFFLYRCSPRSRAATRSGVPCFGTGPGEARDQSSVDRLAYLAGGASQRRGGRIAGYSRSPATRFRSSGGEPSRCLSGIGAASRFTSEVRAWIYSN